MVFLGKQPAPESQLQVGMTDPYLNEPVTYVAEVDTENVPILASPATICTIVIWVVLSIIVPCFCLIFVWTTFFSYRRRKSSAKKTHVYITDQTLVYFRGDYSLQYRRVTVPLTSIASVTLIAREAITSVNIKPTAPPVVNYHQILREPTQSVLIQYLKDPEAFASVVRQRIGSSN